MAIKYISAKDTISIRNVVLRNGKPPESCNFDGDNDSETLHIGAFEGEILVGIASLFKKNNPLFPEKQQVQLRGMAVLPEFRNKSIGEKLLQKAEESISSKGDTVLWFNARKTAEKFYKRNNYRSLGGYFEIESVGTHCVMFKKLQTL